MNYSNVIKEKFGLRESDFLYKVEIKAREHLDVLEGRGVLVDLDILEELISERTRGLEGLLFEVVEATGGAVTRPNSAREVGMWVESKGFIAPRTAKGNYSSGAEELLKIPVPGIQSIVEYRKLLCSLSQLKSIREVQRFGRVHPRYISTKAATGRIYTENPNFQGWGEDAKKIIKADDGWKLLSPDYKSQELRILASFAGVSRFKKAFEEGEDLHSAVASEMLGKPVEEVTKEERHLGKVLNFGTIYGQTPRGLAHVLNVSEDRAAQLQANYFSRFPEIVEWRQGVIAESRKRGYTITPMGRKRELNYNVPRVLWDKLDREAVNHPIQGTGADVIKLMLAKLPKNHERFEVLCPIHDELLCQVREDVDEDVVKNWLASVMEITLPGGVVLEVDFK